jgi:hypothetical protein
MDKDKLGALIEMHSDTLRAFKELWLVQFGLHYPNIRGEKRDGKEKGFLYPSDNHFQRPNQLISSKEKRLIKLLCS